MTWAQRIKRVFGIDVSTCIHYGGALRIVASIEESTAIRAIVAYFEKHDAMEEAHYRSAPRGPSAVAMAMAAYSQDRPRPPTVKTNSH